ncbi:Hsp20/alpha crystallin family protein [Natronorubrum tibetense]|uniref:Molecular chaperone (Small heat shock protein)-like protein n=1 Tax=Natronorubrum tibetense GA33 TaxID=1114856 RepID=L9VJV4_9EURY|nr:Hsp20/alpha crystallin family protein [Natronorubrum tibetense]ELY37262.1 Molecular chaperone (small heat shock protein)- like protein [Natronorubrum tibetense GA33]
MSPSDLRKSIGNALYRQVGRANGRVQKHRSLPVDVLENETSYQVVFDAPGAEPDDVQVRYLEGNVKIRIERFRQFRDGYEMRFPGRGMELDGEAELPNDAVVDPDAGEATLTETGTLRIDIPKDVSIETDDSETDTEPESATAPEADEITVDD